MLEIYIFVIFYKFLTLAFTSSLAAYRFGGGSYGGRFDKLIVKPAWQKEYRKIYEIFTKKAENNLENL